MSYQHQSLGEHQRRERPLISWSRIRRDPPTAQIFWTSAEQALAGSRFSIPGFSGTGFCQIPGSRDFSGRDLPLFLIPGFFRNFSGIFRDFCFCFVCGSNHIIFTNLHHYHCHHHNRPHHHWPRPPFSFIALRKKRQNNCNKGFVCKQYFYQMQ